MRWEANIWCMISRICEINDFKFIVLIIYKNLLFLPKSSTKYDSTETINAETYITLHNGRIQFIILCTSSTTFVRAINSRESFHSKFNFRFCRSKSSSVRFISKCVVSQYRNLPARTNVAVWINKLSHMGS